MPGKMNFLQSGQSGKLEDFEENNGWRDNIYTLQNDVHFFFFFFAVKFLKLEL